MNDIEFSKYYNSVKESEERLIKAAEERLEQLQNPDKISVIETKTLNEIHAVMRATGWHNACNFKPQSDGVLECACVELEKKLSDYLSNSKNENPVNNPWKPIQSAPKCGKEFLAINHDGEIWRCKIDKEGRLLYRTNKLLTPRKFIEKTINGEKWMKEDKEYAEKHEKWCSSWTIWSRGYEFEPVLWSELIIPEEFKNG